MEQFCCFSLLILRSASQRGAPFFYFLLLNKLFYETINNFHSPRAVFVFFVFAKRKSEKFSLFKKMISAPFCRVPLPTRKKTSATARPAGGSW